MAEIRTQDNYNASPTVAPNTGVPDDYLHVNANPDVFGGQVAEAISKTGDTLQQVGQQTAETALQYQNWQNEVDANNATTSYSIFAADQEKEFRKNLGANAATAYPTFQATLENKLQQTADSFKSPMARLAFLNDARTFYDRSQYNASIFTADQMDKAVSASYEGKIAATKNFATLHFDDTRTIQNSINKISDSAYALAQHEGLDKDAANALASEHVGNLLSSVITAQRDQGTTLQQQVQSLKQAQILFQTYKNQSIPGMPGVPLIDAAHQDDLSGKLNYQEMLLNAKSQVADNKAEAGVRTSIKNQLDNTFAMVSRGYTVQEDHLPSDAQIRAAYPNSPEDAQTQINNFDMIRSQSMYNGILPGATPQQISNLIQEAKPDPNNPKTFAKQDRLSTALDAALRTRQIAISRDSAGYVIQSNPNISQLYQDSTKNPALFPNYVHEVQQEQDLMQVPQQDRRILPAEAASSMADDVQSVPEAAPAKMAQLQKQYGSLWPLVFKDMVQVGKLSPGMQAVAILPEQDGQILSKVLQFNSTGKAIADQLPQVDGPRGLGDAGSAIRDNIRDNHQVQTFLGSLSAQGNSPQQTDAIRNSIISLAEGNAYYKGMLVPDATKAAIASFTNYSYLEGSPARIAPDKFDTVRLNTGYFLQNLKTDQIALPSVVDKPGGVTADEYLDRVKATPRWINSPDTKSLWLQDMAGKVVRDKQGNPISLALDLPPMASNFRSDQETGEAALESSGGGQEGSFNSGL